MPRLTPTKIIGVALVLVFCVIELLVPMGGKLDGLMHGRAVGFILIFVALSVVRAVNLVRRAKQRTGQNPE